jgi:hypothetical protein
LRSPGAAATPAASAAGWIPIQSQAMSRPILALDADGVLVDLHVG